MVKNKGGSNQEPEEAPAPEEDPNPLMAEIDAGSGRKADADPVMGRVGDDTPKAPESTPVAPQAPADPPSERMGRLMSRMDYPVEVQYQEGAIRLSPRAIQNVDGNKIAHDDRGKMILPKGVNFVPNRR